MPNERSLKNLRPFQKGQSGNPSGRPKRRPISDSYTVLATKRLPKPLREKLDQKLNVKLPEKITYADALALGQFIKAIGGDAGNAKEVREGIEGRSTQRIEFTGEDGGPVQIGFSQALAEIREIYGLRPKPIGPAPPRSLPLPEDMDRGREPAEGRDQS